MTFQVGNHTEVIHGWGDGPMEAVEYAMERAPNLVENGWAIRSVSHAFGPDEHADGKKLYSAVVLLTRREAHEATPDDSGTDF